jgi:hypothetical protein
MTHHNQTKKLITWFLNLPLDEPIDNKGTSLKFESNTPWSTARRPIIQEKLKKVIKKKENRKSQPTARKAAKSQKE